MTNEDLIEAIKQNDINELRKLLHQNTSLNFIDKNGITPIITAIIAGNTEIVKILINNGADVNGADLFYRTPLMFASMVKNPEIAKLLIANGAKVDVEYSNNMKLNDYSISKLENKRNEIFENYESQVQKLLAPYYLSPHFYLTPLMYASILGNENVVELLLSSSASAQAISVTNLMMNFTDLGQGLLATETLIKRQFVEIDFRDRPKDGLSTLMFASKYGHIKVIELLLNHGASVNLENYSGQTAIMFAAESGHTDIVDLLIRYGADISTKSKIYMNSSTPLSLAAVNGHLDVVELLLDHGAKIDERIGTSTPLMYAAETGDYKLCKFLIERGANVNATSLNAIDGESVLSLAALNGHLDIIKLLINSGADVNMKLGDTGATVLEQAIFMNKLNVAHHLLQMGANPSLCNSNPQKFLELSINKLQRDLELAASLRNGETTIKDVLKSENASSHSKKHSRESLLHLTKNIESKANELEGLKLLLRSMSKYRIK